jgi:hypothetical protein
VFRYVAGALAPSSALSPLITTVTIVTGIAFLPVIWSAVRALNPRATISPEDRLVFIGWLVVFAAFLVIGSSGSLSPGNERFGIVLLAPGIVALVRAYEIWGTRGKAAMTLVGALVPAAGAFLLAGFYCNYFAFIMHTGGDSEETFRTAAVEPKLQALHFIESQSLGPSGGGILVATSSYWNYQPLRYLAADNAAIGTVWTKPPLSPDQAEMLNQAASSGQLWCVEFAGSPEIAGIKRKLAAGKAPYAEKFIDDYSGRPILDIVQVLRNTESGRE